MKTRLEETYLIRIVADDWSDFGWKYRYRPRVTEVRYMQPDEKHAWLIFGEEVDRRANQAHAIRRFVL